MNDLTGYSEHPLKIRVLFFSVLRDLTKQEEIDFSLPASADDAGTLVGSSADSSPRRRLEGVATPGIEIRELLTLLFAQYEGLGAWNEKLLIAVNCEYASRDDFVKPGDEVAIMPPVQGG